jgi:hypothetical protein
MPSRIKLEIELRSEDFCGQKARCREIRLVHPARPASAHLFFAGGKLVKTVSGVRQYHGLLRELREVLKIDVREPVEA